MALVQNGEEPAWLVIVQRKRKIRHAALQPYLHQTAGIHDDAIIAINGIEELAERIAIAEFTAQDVVSAYVRKAALAHHKSNCLTEIMFDDALERARELDAYLAKHKRPIGPLHGVVMTLKDQFNVKGYDTTLGYVGRTFQPAADNALVVRILKDLGVIFIAKTNLPQSIMWCETENPLWGLTTNPLDPSLTPGGSTGGESALLSQHGSLIGWGTDIGGSVRIPSHMLGLYALKPSSSRLPYLGTSVSTEGQEHVPSAVGPMARTLQSIHVVTKAIINSAPWKFDPKVHPLPWREREYHDVRSRSLVIGLLTDDGVVKVHPPIERVLTDVAEKLRQAGHEVFEWDGSGHQECINIMDRYYTADGGEDIKREIAAGGEPMVPHVAALVTRAPAISVYDYWQLNKAKAAAQKAYLDKWRSLRSPASGREADILLTPTMPHSAVQHRACKYVGYTKVWNFLDYTAAVLPAGEVVKTLDPAKSEPSVVAYVPRNDLDEWNWRLYDPESMDALPLSVQIVGRRLEEEKVLGAAAVIDSIIRQS